MKESSWNAHRVTRRRFLTVAAAGAGMALLGSCGSSSDAGDGGGGDETAQLRFSTASTPEQHHTKAAKRFAELVDKYSDGAITVEVFDSGSLYDQTSEQQALLNGSLDMAYSAPNWISERVPEASIVSVPYLLNDYEHLYAVMDGTVGEEIYAASVEKAKIRPLTSLYLGTRQLNLTDKVNKVMTPEDLAGVNLRVPDAPSWIRMAKAMGASPTPVAFNELYLALQTGTVDGQENPLPTTIDAKFQEVTSQVSTTSHLVDFVMPTINERVWQDLSSAQQDAIQKAWDEARDYGTDLIVKQEESAVNQLKEAGLDVYEPDRDAFRDGVLPQYLEDDELTNQWGDGALETIRDSGRED